MIFKKEYNSKVQAIVTEAYIFPDFKSGELPAAKFYSPLVVWDTGAEHTSISMEVVEALQLKPKRTISVAVLGGDTKVNIYEVAVGLPNGKLYHNVEVFGAEIDEYAALIGMDLITETDFVITNKDNKTIFQFRTPSEGGIELDNTPDAN